MDKFEKYLKENFIDKRTLREIPPFYQKIFNNLIEKISELESDINRLESLVKEIEKYGKRD